MGETKLRPRQGETKEPKGQARLEVKGEVWQTKFGSRRVRRDPPTIDEAIVAASGLTDDPQQQIEIAASLMDVTHESVRAAMGKTKAQRMDVNRVVFSGRKRSQRAVVVQHKPERRGRSPRSS